MGLLAQAIGGFWNDITGKTSAMLQEQKFNERQAQIAREENRYLSNTAIQRQTADAKAAGINPAMMYANSSASGASTPSSPSAHGSALGGSGTVAGVLNAVANVASTFNRDSDHSNDVTLRDVMKASRIVSKLLK